ncbi:unnamed protein product [Sphenostylis stenocarpa]|uniref:Uncharacterized protein n=1 Tax=Sphenostylis stenocarpa TaxID=92480 RepID=A0AA86RX89_9FABA|nr:unnamed protein product [Sphenostylis stenocarpa]
MTQNLWQQFDQRLMNLGLSQQATAVAGVPSGEDTKHLIRCELYAEDTDSPRLVAFGKMFQGVTILLRIQ